MGLRSDSSVEDMGSRFRVLASCHEPLDNSLDIRKSYSTSDLKTNDSSDSNQPTQQSTGPFLTAKSPRLRSVSMVNNESFNAANLESNWDSLSENLPRQRRRSRRITLIEAGNELMTPAVTLHEEDESATGLKTQSKTPVLEEVLVDSSAHLKTCPLPVDLSKERKISRIFWMLQSMQDAMLSSTVAAPYKALSISNSSNNQEMSPRQILVPINSSTVSFSLPQFEPNPRPSPVPQQTHRPLRACVSSASMVSSVSSSRSFLPRSQQESRSSTTSTETSGRPHLPVFKNSRTAALIGMSSLYAEFLIVVCIAYILSEVFTHNVPLHYYEGFFTYLYVGSILFLCYVFGYLLRPIRDGQEGAVKDVFLNPSVTIDTNSLQRKTSVLSEEGNDDVWLPHSEVESTVGKIVQNECSSRKGKKTKVLQNEHSHGSFFLRVGAVAFGLGTMLYNGLEFGAFFEIPPESPCYQILRGINPVLQATFTFMQMYFIFCNSRLNIQKFKALSRFGLMHLVATNVCVWIRTLVRESLQEIAEVQHPHHRGVVEHPQHVEEEHLSTVGNKTHPSLWDLTSNYTCGRQPLLGSIVLDSAPFLYPFLIEFSLIGAAVLYVIWAHIGLGARYEDEFNRGDVDENSQSDRKQYLRVDCMGSSKGLFMGLFVLLFSLISLTLFFVLVAHAETHLLAVFMADATHSVVLFLSIVAMIVGLVRVRTLQFCPEHHEELGSLLLRVSALGIFAYSVFSIIAGALSPWVSDDAGPSLMVLVNGILSVAQVMVQMLYMSDLSHRRSTHPEEKPGRQSVTFMIICNLALWLQYTFEMQKVEANPVQLKFYGFLPWAIVQRITLPLCIFYRFHSAVVCAEIWKNTYRM